MLDSLSRITETQAPEFLRRQRWILLFVIPVVVGAVAGILVLHPINELVYYYEHRPEAPSAWAFITSQLLDSLRLRTLTKTLFYAGVGATFGLLTAFMFNALYKRARQIQRLSAELEKDLLTLIAKGESGSLEFKSTFRWDLKQEKVNRALEVVVVKSLAGFMNGGGGTLLIGVADDGSIVGLDKDYSTLKKKNQDGFEQAIIGAVASNLGTDATQHVHVMFHDVLGKDVCRVIARASSRPVYLKQDKTAMFYLRAGGGTRRLNVEEAVDYIADHWD
jgi:hypothetical protein